MHSPVEKQLGVRSGDRVKQNKIGKSAKEVKIIEGLMRATVRVVAKATIMASIDHFTVFG